MCKLVLCVIISNVFSLMTDHPLVSIMALCHNHERFVIMALDSIRNQTYKNIELFIIDDNSTDASQELIQNWIAVNKVECTFIKHSVNKTIGFSYNEFLTLAKGEFISSIATDDVYSESKIANQVAFFEKLPREYGILYSDLNVIDEDNVVLNKSFYNWFLNDYQLTNENVLASLITHGHNIIQVTGALVRKEIYDKVGPYDESLVVEDFDMSIRWARITKFYYSPVVVGSYRKSNNQFNAVYWRDAQKRLKVNYMVHAVYVKNLDLEKEFREVIIRKLKANHFSMLTNENFLHRDNIKLSAYLFRLKPTSESFLILIAAFLNLSSAFVATKSILTRFSLFFENHLKAVPVS